MPSSVLATINARHASGSAYVHPGEQPPLHEVESYCRCSEYSDADLRDRYVQVEASHGCPLKRASCLSALDRTE
jgi:hypothetical protein